MDRALEVKTVRRKHHDLAAHGKATDLLTVLDRHHMASTQPTREDKLGLLLYADGHARFYRNKKRTDKQLLHEAEVPGPVIDGGLGC